MYYKLVFSLTHNLFCVLYNFFANDQVVEKFAKTMTTVTIQSIEDALDTFYFNCTGRSLREFKPVRRLFTIRTMKKRLISEINKQKASHKRK